MEETARDNLRHALWRVRKALPKNSKIEYLLTDDIVITFNASADYWLDAKALEKLSEDASADGLISVLSEYRGELLPGFYDDWVVLEREHLNSIFEHHMARLMSCLEDEKRWSEILDWGERWIKLGQMPEPAYRALMSAHAAEGEMSKVAETYERCVTSLKEIGFEPSEQTRGLYEKLKAGKMPLETESALPSSEKRKESARTNLPVPITSFIGREKEVGEVIQLLDRNRLVTLTGTGGVGKTRLAIQSSNRMPNRFKHGVWWVELAPQAAAQVLDVRETPGQPLIESVKNFLRGKQILLVLDNCEHLIDDCARLADDLLTHCADLKILTTSREGLGITGEMAYQVPSLSLPAPKRLTLTDLLMEYEGVRLFVERARAVKADFALTEQNAAAVVQICARLDGIPLALELAAARTKLLSVEHIAERLNDRFNLLTQGSRAALPRHQTLRAAIDWSYDLLPEEARVLFRRLSVFAGGFTLDAAEEVCSEAPLDPRAILDLLTRLVDRSLVKVTREGEEERYSMLETIREYALDQLRSMGEDSAAHARHLGYFLKFAEQAESKITGGTKEGEWLARLNMEHEDLRAAIAWGLKNDLTSALRMTGALGEYWNSYDYGNDGVKTLTDAVNSSENPPDDVLAKALHWQGLLMSAQGEYDSGRQILDRSLSLARKTGNERVTATILNGLGVNLWLGGSNSEAQEYCEKALMLWQKLGDLQGIGLSIGYLGYIALQQGEIEKAETLCTEALKLGRETRDDRIIAGGLTTLGFVSWAKGEPDQAAKQFAEVLALQSTLRVKLYIYTSLVGIALVAFTRNQPIRAAQLAAAADALLEITGAIVPPNRRSLQDFYMAAIRNQLDEAAFEQAWAEGRAMTMEEAVAFALEPA